MRTQILQVTKKAMQEPTRQIRIIIKKDATDKIKCLTGKCLNGTIALNGKRLTLMEVEQTGIWENDSDRLVEITLGYNFDPETFANQMHNALEEIEVANY